MNRNLLLSLTIPLTLIARQVNGQGTFRNLNFEQAMVIDVPANASGGSVSTTAGIPSWAAYSGSNLDPVGSILHNTVSLGSPAVGILGPNYDKSLILEGSYSLVLQSGTPSSDMRAAVGQIGEIPTTARSIFFKGAAQSDSFVGIELTFAGNQIPFSRVGPGELAGDISAYAGQTGELRFTAVPGNPITGQTLAVLDDIQFSSRILPEPATVTLLVGGLTLFLFGSCPSRRARR